MRHQKLQRSELLLFVMPVLTLVLLQCVITFKARNAEYPFWQAVTDPILDKLSPGRKRASCIDELKPLGLGIARYSQVNAAPFSQNNDSEAQPTERATNK